MLVLRRNQKNEYFRTDIVRMETTAKTLAELLGGEVIGDPETKVKGPARIEQACSGSICFYANPKYEKYVYDTKAAVLIVNKSFDPQKPVPATLIKVDDAYAAVPRMLEYFSAIKRSRHRGNRFISRLNPKISIAWTARIGKGTHIYPQVYLGPKVKVGKNCILYPGVKVYHDCVIGDNCIIHANAVIGADGFGFAPLPDGSYKKIPQLGNVVIEDDVEIGAGTTVDRATMNSTIIHKGVKLDNLCQVAHNVEVGGNTVMAALSGLAGSAKVGRHCVIGGQSGVQGHISIADNTTIAGQTGVIGTVKEEGKVLMGYPALEYRNYMRSYAIFKNAPDKEK